MSAPGRYLEGPAVWLGRDLRNAAEWMLELSAPQLDELTVAGRTIAGRALTEIGPADFSLPTFAPVLRRVAAELLHGRGFALLRGVPTDQLGARATAALFWGIGAHLGRAVPQNAHGHLLGHVIDVGADASDPSTRIYQTNRRQGYHTDSADLVGLLCMRTARSGGLSRLASCAGVHNVMLDRHPDLLPALFEPLCTDHRGEAPPGAAPYFTAPVFSWFDGELSVLYQRAYIESAQRFDDVTRLDARQVAALDALDATLDDADVHLEMELRPGDIQFVHNHALLHDRTGFEDWPEPERRRHLLRLWLCPASGRELPAWFAERLGSTAVGDRGGVACPDVALQAPLTLIDAATSSRPADRPR